MGWEETMRSKYGRKVDVSFERPIEVDPTDLAIMLDCCADADEEEKIRAQLAERDARIGELLRVEALYSDALNVIAHHPVHPDDFDNWMQAKAREALAKTEAARRGEIYAQLTALAAAKGTTDAD